MSSNTIRAALERLAKAAERVADVDPLAALEVAAALADLAAPMEGDAARAVLDAAEEGDSVPVPLNADMAAGMVLLGDAYLREHSPERLRPAAPPAPPEGEVGELVAELRDAAFDLNGSDPAKSMLTRAADLLQQDQGSVKSAPSLTIAPAPAVVPVAIPGEQWHEDDGACLWWRFEIDEAPWVGDPRDSDWPGYHTHFTRIVCPVLPAPQGGEVEG